jgi:hypothetical protein
MLIAIGLAVVLVLLVEDFWQQVILSPLLHVGWFLSLVVRSVPQALFWGAFILVAVIIAGKSLAREGEGKRVTHRRTASHKGAVATWSALLQAAERHHFSKWRLAQALRRLAGDLLSTNASGNLDVAGAEGHDLESILPPEIHSYFYAPVPTYKTGLWILFWRRSRPGDGALDMDPAQVVNYLEDQVEAWIGDRP